MKLRNKKLPAEIIEFVDMYKGKKKNEIDKISIKWTCDNDQNYLYNKTLTTTGGYSIYWVETFELINKANFGEMGGHPLMPELLFNNIYERDWRVAKILDHCFNAKYLDPPDVNLDYSDKITFGDGRHRTIVAFHLGLEKIPIAIEQSMVNKISSILTLSEDKNDKKM